MVLLALAVAFIVGSFTGAALLVGPAGFRPTAGASPGATGRTPAATPSPSPAPTPAANGLAGASMVFDGTSGQMLLFGESDTRLWNGKEWKLQPKPPGPSRRTDAALAYDPVHHNVVMHGGLGSGGSLDETWLWNGSRWLLTSPGTAPPVWTQTLNGLTYNLPANEPLYWDKVLGSVVLFAYARYYGSTYNTPELNQLWSWNGTTWTLLRAAGMAPAHHGLHEANLAYDAAHHQMVFFGHVDTVATTWTFDGTTWRQVASAGPSDTDFSLAPDDARSAVIMFTSSGATWEWNGTSWVAQNPRHSPSPRIGAAMAYDPLRKVVMLYGGQSAGYGSQNVFNDTWTWNGTDWTQVA
jgi:hypothetical protein